MDGFLKNIFNSKDFFIKSCFFVIGIIFSILYLFIPIKLLFVVFFSICFLIFSFYHLQISFSFFLFFTFIIPHEFWNNGILLLATVFYLIVSFIKSIYNKNIINLKDNIPASLIVFTFLALISFIFTYDFWDSLRIISLLMAGIFISFFIILNFNDKKSLICLISLLFFSMVIASLYGIYHYKVGIAVRLDFTDVLITTGFGRLYSTMDNPNNFAEFLIMLLPIGVALIISSKDDFKRLLYFILITPCFLALMYTSSRSAYLAIVISAGVFVLLSNKRLVPFFILIGILLIPFIPTSIITRLQTIGKDTSSQFRLEIWKGSLQALRDNWFYGIGAGPESFAKVFRTYVDDKTSSAMHSHNLFLQIWLEMGLAAIISFVIFIFNALKTCIVNSINSKDFKYYFAGMASGLLAIIVMSFVEYVWFYPRVMFTFWILIGLIFAFNKISRSNF